MPHPLSQSTDCFPQPFPWPWISFYFLATSQHMKFLGQGPHPRHSCNLPHSCGNTGFFTHCAEPGIQRCCWFHCTTVGAPATNFLSTLSNVLQTKMPSFPPVLSHGLNNISLSLLSPKDPSVGQCLLLHIKGTRSSTTFLVNLGS